MQYIWIRNAEDFIKMNVTASFFFFFLRISNKTLDPFYIFLAFLSQSHQISSFGAIIEYVQEIIRWFKFN